MPAHRPSRAHPLLGAAIGVLLVASTACSAGGTGERAPAAADDPDSATLPVLRACHVLTPKDTAEATSDAAGVACAEPHTAETFAVGTFPAAYASAAYDDRGLGRYIYRTCDPGLAKFLGSDDSEVERSRLSWAWFRPSEQAWAKGARWYRCDVVGGSDEATSYDPLPTEAKNLLGGAPLDRWMQCAEGRTVNSAKVACSEPHDWRAVTTIKLGQPDDPYPGDRLVQIRSQQYCSDSVGAWLNYPTKDFRYGMTIYHQAEWKAGNRRTVCWARTTK